MATFADALLDDDADRAVRVVALALLADAAAVRPRLDVPGDDEALHDFRVAVRRLRSWLKLHADALAGSAPGRAQRWLARLAAATNPGRDAEVLRGWLAAGPLRGRGPVRTGARWLHAQLEAGRAAEAATVLAEVARDFARAQELLEARLPTYRVTMHVHEGPPHVTFAAVQAAALRRQLAALRRRLGGVHAPHDVAALHRARIAGKRLRYLLEPVAAHVEGGAGAVKRLKQLQDALGDLHDAHAWQAVIAEAEARVAREALEAAVATVRPASGAGAAPARAPRGVRAGLHALLALVRSEADGRFAAVRRDWLEDRASALAAVVEPVAAALEARGVAGVEIERKYLLDALPQGMAASAVLEIEQGYLPGRRLVERVRRVRHGDEVRCYRTVKVGRGLVRVELEEECAPAVFDALWPLTEGRRVRKRRHVVEAGAVAWEIDEFLDRALVLAEVELPSADTAVEVPGWLSPVLAREVTGDPAFGNLALAR